MNDDTSVHALVAPMRERQVVLEGKVFAVDRARVLARMAAVGRAPPRWPVYIGFAAAAALFLVLPVWWLGRGGSGVEVTSLSGSAVRVESETGEASRLTKVGTLSSLSFPRALETGEGSRAVVRTRDGLAIELAAGTRVSLGRLRTDESRLDLGRGSVRCTVAHRSPSRPFQVVAPGVTVVDLGTIFTVNVDPETQATSVSVEEGEVLVKHGDDQTRVQAPGTWSSAPHAATPSPSTPPPRALPPVASSAPAPDTHAPKVRRPAPTRAPAAATLRDEARLLRFGLAAERQGDAAEATARFKELLARYPQSPLAPDAREALRRVTRGTP